MLDIEQKFQSVFDVAVDVAFSFLAFALITVPTLSLADSAFSSQIGSAVVPMALALTLAGTVLYAGQDWSLARLGHFTGAYLACTLVWVAVFVLVDIVLRLPVFEDDALAIFVAWVLALVTAAVLVYYDENVFGA